jgi:clan AA aspartic protease (TIGR02281 family)
VRVSTTGGLAVIIFSMSLGFAWGWWYRDLNHFAEQSPERATPGDSGKSATAAVSLPQPLAAPKSFAGAPVDVWALGRMLDDQQFRGATAFYYDALRADSGNIRLLRPTVDSYVQRCLEQCDSETIVALIDAWLETFYDDIPMLIALAEHEEQQGQPEAAANTLLRARTYALRPADQRAVIQALQRLTLRTDERLSTEQRWIDLLGYYEFLAAIDLITSEFELRRALLYKRLGEQARGSTILANLLAADDGSNSQWTATLRQHLAETTVETAPGVELTDAIPLQRRGGGYIVEVEINDEATLQLLVDTGASMTTLSRDSFRRLNRPDFSLLGTRLFNTANGYTRGEVYLAASLTLGDERLEGTNIAVLDFQGMDDIDGLLGMNVLRQFRFEIDQSLPAMSIRRRE